MMSLSPITAREIQGLTPAAAADMARQFRAHTLMREDVPDTLLEAKESLEMVIAALDARVG